MVKKTTSKVQFKKTPLHKKTEPSAISYLAQRSSFWIATLSVAAFVTGNMVGQHGWYVFFRSVFGNQQVAHAPITKTCKPVEFVPNYTEWSRKYGGSPSLHTYREVPQSVREPLPFYNKSAEQFTNATHLGQVYSAGHGKSYKGNTPGSHVGNDIRLPEGTPVHSIMNGVVVSAGYNSGFGYHVIIEHNNATDPAHPSGKNTLRSIYGHLSTTYPEVGTVVECGDIIGLSGDSGLASGYHLHLQLERVYVRNGKNWEKVVGNSFWPFTYSEMRAKNMTFYEAVNSGLGREKIFIHTLDPMEYVQNYNTQSTSTVVQGGRVQEVASTTERRAISSTRIGTNDRFAVSPRRRSYRTNAESRQLAGRSNTRSVARQTAIERRRASRFTKNSSRRTVATRAQTHSAGGSPPAKVSSIDFAHDGGFSGREWETVTVTIKDKDGEVTTLSDGEKIYLRAAYGEADFEPTFLTASDFSDGQATIKILPRGRRTLVIQAQNFNESLSRPLRYGL